MPSLQLVVLCRSLVLRSERSQDAELRKGELGSPFLWLGFVTVNHLVLRWPT